MKTIITCDSGMDPLDTTYSVPVEITNLTNGTSFEDMENIMPEAIIDDAKSIYLTSAPNIYNYLKLFEKLLAEECDVVHLGMSSGISSCNESTLSLVKNELTEKYGKAFTDHFYFVNSLTGATGGTLITSYADYLAKEGYQAREIKVILEEYKKRLKTYFLVPDASGFIKSGRDKSEVCFKDRALLLTLNALKKIMLKYVVDFNNEGNLYFSEIIRRNSNNNAMHYLVKQKVNANNIEEYDPQYVVIGNLYPDNVNLDEIANYLASFNYFKNIINKRINATVAPYGCKDLCGLSLVKKP
jgi:fatty acid-binding protein DegV